MEELSEFIVFHETLRPNESANLSQSSDTQDFKWSSNSTKLLIDLYEKYRGKVGTMAIRTVKQMWHLIAVEISSELKAKITPANCENRWRVLDRNYKKYVDNKNSTGRGRKYFEFVEQMDKVFGGRRNITPEIILSSETIHTPDKEEEQQLIEEISSTENIQNGNTSTSMSVRGKKKRRTSILETMRLERVAYQENRMKLEMAKFEELKKRNELLKERNAILKEQKYSCCSTHRESS